MAVPVFPFYKVFKQIERKVERPDYLRLPLGVGYGYNRDASGRLVNNRLAALSDAAGVNSGHDIGNNSYSYDAIGNLKTDAAAGITNVDWRVYGKIKQIAKNSGNLVYDYDASGNRVSKLYNGLSTYYVRDAQGNTLGV
jgi:hypothetical protein